MGSQKDSKNDKTNRKDQNSSQNASSRGTPGNKQAARSEEQLDQEERSLIGNTAEDRNLTGSTTYVTLPDQKGDQAQNQSSRQGSSSQGSSSQGSSSQGSGGSQSSGGRSSGNQQSGHGDSYGSSHGDTQR